MTTIVHGIGAQTLRHVPIDQHGRPRVVASATYEVDDLRYSETNADRDVDSGSATVSSVSTTTTADAGPGEVDPAVISVTSATGITAGRQYLLSAASGLVELVHVRAVSGLTVYLHFELRHDFASGTAFRGVECSMLFPSAEANDDLEVEAEPHPYQVTWTYTIDGDIRVVPQIVWLSRVSTLPIVDELYVLRADPTISSRLRNRAEITDAIATATEDYHAEVRARGVDPTEFRGNDSARVAVRARALEIARRWCGPAEHDVAEAARFGAQYRYLMDQLLAGRPRPGTVTVETRTNTGTQDTDARHSIFRRR